MPTPPEEFPWSELGRWFAGEMTPAEAEALERWVAEDPDRAELVAALREAWSSAGAAGESWHAGSALRRVREAAAAETRIIAHLGVEGTGAAARGKWRRVAPALAAAAALAIVAGGSFIFVRATRRADVPVAVTFAEYRTPRGQRLALRLADGTQVMLAPGSVLHRPSDYGVRERRLDVEGQAYFVVAHDSTRQFTVHTRHLVARDLGTRFDVRAYPDEQVTDVVVAEGEVEVNAAGSGRADSAVAAGKSWPGALVTAGQLARVDDGGDVDVRSGVDLGRRLAWTEGRLVFKDTPLREVELQLERWYDVEVRLGSPDLGSLRVTGAFGDEPVTQVLEAVARSLGLVVRRTGDVYQLGARPVPPPSHPGEP